jgi:flagellar capping protein FliD
MSMSVDGLVSGMDTTSIISGLMQTEAAPQTALKSRLSTTKTAASAYRTVNTTYAAVRTAAEALQKVEIWGSAKATSNSTGVTATATGTNPAPGSLTFTVQSLASAHGLVNQNATWTSTTAAYGASSIEVFDKAGVSKGTITIGGTGTLTDAAAAINADTTHGLTASVVQVRAGSSPLYALQINAKTTGAASEFTLGGAGTFGITSQASDAELKIGTPGAAGAYSVYSSTNTFDSVMPGATMTVSKADPATPVTVTIAKDPDAIATKMQALVDAVNSALKTTRDYTSSATGSTAALKGDYALTSLVSRLLTGVAGAVGKDGSPAKIGLETNRDGSIKFTKSTFVDALKTDPAMVQRMVDGSPAAGTTAAVPGIADRLFDIAKAASDSTTGSIVALANGQDSVAKDLQTRIEAWDLRLAKRKETLTRQFTAMETALSSLKNQSNWLAGQISSLPTG